jgi:flagellar biosynthetic protein FliR
MTEATLQALLRQIGPDHVVGFFLVLARLSPLFVIAPLFSSSMLPRQVRGIIAVALAIGLTPIATHGQTIPSDPLLIAAMVVSNLLVGLAFAFAIGMVFSAVEAAGELLYIVSGFSYGAIVDPVNGNQGGVLTSLYGMVGLALFSAIGGDAWTLRGIGRTLDLVPLTRAPAIGSLTTGVEAAFGSLFVSAVEVAAPALLALLVTDIAFGMVSKVVPQLSIFAVGFPLKVGVALLIVGVSLPFIGGFMSNQISSEVSTALGSMSL